MNEEVSSQQEVIKNPVEPSYQEAKAFLDMAIGDCKKCSNRRVLGFNRTYNHIVKCSCLIKFEAKAEKLKLEGKLSDENLLKVQ